MNKLPLTEDVANTWATIISLSGHNFKAERDNREMEKTPMASSTLTVESEGKETHRLALRLLPYNTWATIINLSGHNFKV